MAIKMIKEEIEKEVSFLTEVDVNFVSLVKHGANKQPFRIVKSERKEGMEKVSMIIQSILLPKGLSLASLSSEKDLRWLVDAKETEVLELDDYRKLVQMPAEKFEKDSLSLLKLGKTGAFAMIGKLQDRSMEKEALSIGKKQTEKLMEMPQAPMSQPVAQEERQPLQVSFGDMFYSEMDNMVNVIRGTLSQTGVDEKKRKGVILGAVDAFKTFLSMGLDSIGEKSTSIAKVDIREKAGSAELEQAVRQLVSQIKKPAAKTDEGGITDMFATKEEFVQAVTEVVKSFMEEKGKSEESAKALEAEKNEKESLVSRLTSMETAIKAVTEKQEAMGAQLATDPAATEAKDEKAAAEKKEKSVFSGMLTGKAA